MTPKSIISIWNEKIAYYFVTNIQKFASLYDKQQGGYKLEDIKNHIIKLPLRNKKIDFEFIEYFISEIEVDQIIELGAYLSVSNLRDYTLTSEEQKILNDFKDEKIVHKLRIRSKRPTVKEIIF